MRCVEFRAFRGTQRSSIYRSHVIGVDALDRIVEAAGQDGLGRLDPRRTQELEPPAARRLAAQLTELRSSAVLLDLDGHLTALAEVANWCARSREKAWLRISPRC